MELESCIHAYMSISFPMRSHRCADAQLHTSVADLKTEDTRQRIIPAQGFTDGGVHDARTAQDYAATMKPALPAVVAAEFDEIIRCFREAT